MGLLVQIREKWAAFLALDAPSGAAAFFNPAAPVLPIPIFTEKLATLEEKINEGLRKTGLSILIATVTASDAQDQFPGELYFNKTLAVARVFENPATNLTGVCASDGAEAVAWFTRKFKPFDAPMRFMSIGLGKDPKRLCYDVIFQVSTGSMTPPVRA